MIEIQSLEVFERVMEGRHIPADEMVQRYAQFAVLRCIALNRELRAKLILKGGNALDLIYHGDRSTKDIDFSNESTLLENWFRENLGRAFGVSGPVMGMMLRVQRCERRPKGENATRATWALRIGYAHIHRNAHEYRRLLNSPGASSSQVVEMDVSENEFVGGWTDHTLKGLRVASLDDIVAEKLRALLQQPERKRTREQDVYDIASIWRNEAYRQQLSPSNIRRFHREKCRIRDVETGLEYFQHAEIRERAERDYAGLADTVRATLIPFDEAWRCVIELVEWAQI